MRELHPAPPQVELLRVPELVVFVHPAVDVVPVVVHVVVARRRVQRPSGGRVGVGVGGRRAPHIDAAHGPVVQHAVGARGGGGGVGGVAGVSPGAVAEAVLAVGAARSALVCQGVLSGGKKREKSW